MCLLEVATRGAVRGGEAWRETLPSPTQTAVDRSSRTTIVQLLGFFVRLMTVVKCREVLTAFWGNFTFFPFASAGTT